MTAWVVVCERARPNQGRNRNLTYVNVLFQTRRLDGVASLSEWLTNNAGHPWTDPTFNEFVIEITEAEFNQFQAEEFPFFHDGRTNKPKMQQQFATSGAPKSLGAFADPTDAGNVFTVGAVLQDQRWIVRIYDEDPVMFPSANHIGHDEFDESETSALAIRYLRLFDENDVPSSTNAQNQRAEIGGKLMDFDFFNGVASFQVDLSRAGEGIFPSNHQYRIVGPNGEDAYTWRIYGKVLRVASE